VGEIMTELMLDTTTRLNIEMFRLNRPANTQASG
jgi:hypothetical protein